MSKITPEDMDAVRKALRRGYRPYGQTMEDDQIDGDLASILVNIYDRGFAEGFAVGYDQENTHPLFKG